jgi:hypothetical protein
MNIDAHDVFVLRQREAVLVRLPSFEWDFTIGLRVLLRGSGPELKMKQTGTGNHEGRATILLSADKEWGEAEAVLRALLAGGVVTLTVASS